MTLRHGIAAVLAAGGGLGAPLAVAASAQNPPPKNERTHPRVSPQSGGTATTFKLTFTLRETPGHQGAMATEYQAEISPPQSAPSSCWPDQPRPIIHGQKGQRVHVRLSPPSGGWCEDRYRVTVFLVRGPYCPPGHTDPCPEFATQMSYTGQTHFTVG